MLEYAQQKAITDSIPPCPICGIRISQIYKHVIHCHKDITWQQFESNGWVHGKVYYTASHKETLSKNKKTFYDSERGLENKKELKARFSGNNNPACRIDVREKISKARTGQKKSLKARAIDSKNSIVKYMNRTDFCSYGYLFWVMIDDKEHLFKSKTEFTIYLMLKHFGITNFKFEPFAIEYYDESLKYNRNYILDLIVDGKYYEIKSNEKAFKKDIKYKYVNDKLNKLNRNLTLLTPVNFKDVFNIPFETFSKFNADEAVINEIRLGNCKVKLPSINKGLKFLKESFGDNFEAFIKERNDYYEDKKRNDK